jgi:thiamine pyrophosphate-dependent acetolactate synthase large subunit-like protein
MWQFKNLNLADIGRPMGCQSERVDGLDEIRPALERAIHCWHPAVIDVASDMNALAPV